MDFKVRILSKSETSGDSETTLEVIKRYGRKVYATDFCVSQGCDSTFSKVSEGSLCAWGTLTPIIGCKFRYYDIEGMPSECSVDDYTYLGVRPVITYSDVSYMCKDIGINPYGVREVVFGEYPQIAIDPYSHKDLKKEIDKAYFDDKILKPTGKCYSSSEKYMGSEKLIEYEYKGNKYVRQIVSSSTNNSILKAGRSVWMKVEPIVWLVDEKNDLLIAKNALFSGVPMKIINSDDPSFIDSSLDKFLNEYFAKEIIPINTYYNNETIEKLIRELVDIRDEMTELVKDEKVNRYIKLASRSIALTNELKNLDEEKEEIYQSPGEVDMSSRTNMKIIGLKYTDEEKEKTLIKEKSATDIIIPRYPGDSMCF